MKKLDLGYIWFCASFDANGNITGLQEHDMHEGGGIKIPEGVEPNIFFLSRVYARSQFKEHRDRALKFVLNAGE